MTQAIRILNNWITIAHDRQMQPQFRLFWYLRDMLDDTFVAEEQKHEAICFLRDKCKESEDKSTILLALKGKGEI